MSTKFLVFVLGTFLLVQCAHSSAIGKKADSSASESSEESNKINKEVSPTQKEDDDDGDVEFFATIFLEATALSESIYNKTRAAFDPLIARVDLNADTVKTGLEEKLEKVKALIEKQSKPEEILKDFVAIVAKFNETTESTENLPQLNRDVIKAQESLNAEMKTTFSAFADKVVAASEKYWNNLSAAQQQKETKFYDEFMRIKNEPDLEKKLSLLETAMSSSEEKE